MGILGGITLFSLAVATPAILGAIGFGSLGPVAGSIAAGWQASIGTVVAGSLFAFLQSAAMGGAAMGLFLGIGAFGGVIAVALGLASLKGMRQNIVGFVQKSKKPVAAVVENLKEAVGGVAGNFNEAVGTVAENFNQAVVALAGSFNQAVVPLAENFNQAVGGLAGNFVRFFGKRKTE
jgi:Interferon-induced 6-16 family